MSYSWQLIRPGVYIIYPNPHGLCHLLILPTEKIVIARTRALSNTFYPWFQHTPLFVYRGETIHACACHSTQEHRAHFQIHVSFCLVWLQFENCLGNPQHHWSMCKAPGVTMTLTTVWVFYVMYGKVGKSHTVKYEQPLCFMVTLLMFVTFGSVDKKP